MMGRGSEQCSSLRGVRSDVAGARHLSRNDRIPKKGTLATSAWAAEGVSSPAPQGPLRWGRMV